jgi:hypothetical protein
MEFVAIGAQQRKHFTAFGGITRAVTGDLRNRLHAVLQFTRRLPRERPMFGDGGGNLGIRIQA